MAPVALHHNGNQKSVIRFLLPWVDIQGEGAREVLVKKFLLIDRIRFLEN